VNNGIQTGLQRFVFRFLFGETAMPQELINVMSQDGSSTPVKARRVMWAAGNAPFPRCQWCKLQKPRMLVELVQQGFAWNLIEAVCYCDSCHLATIVSFEAPVVNEGGADETEL
jgi:hypothetical protein